jgi:hypothetical protein
MTGAINHQSHMVNPAARNYRGVVQLTLVACAEVKNLNILFDTLVGSDGL